jgi:predicted aspartyl protease
MSTFMVQKPVPPENIPFRLAGGQNPLILVPVHVNDKGPYEFILDTGASHCLLAQELSVTLGVRPVYEKQAMGAGGPVKLAFARVASLSVGSARQRNVPVALTSELERFAVAIGSRVDGDLGFAFLKDFALTIDYQTSSLSFADGSAFSHHSPNPIPFQLAAPHKPLILVQVIVNEKGPFPFVLDTGASRTIVSSELARELAIETTDDCPAIGGGGTTKILTGKVSSLTIGDAVVCDQTVGVGEFLMMLSKAVGTRLDGVIGYNFLNRFRVTIDYPEKILEFEPVEGIALD